MSIWNILILVGIVGQIIVYVLLAAFMIKSLKNGTRDIDYLVLYSAGYIAKYDSPARVYDLNEQRQVQESVLSLQGISHFYPYNHPPFLLPFQEITTGLDYVSSYLRWAILLIVIYSGGIVFLSITLRRFGWKTFEIVLFGMIGFLFYPIFASYLKGQDTAFFILGLCLWIFGLFTDRDWVAGIGLGFVMARPQAALFLAIPFLFRQRKVFWWFLISGSSLILVSLLLVGFQGMLDFANILLLSGKGYGLDANVMINLKGALMRVFPEISDISVNILTYSGYVLGIIFLSIYWARSSSVTMTHIGIACLLYLFFTPHIHSHDWTMLLIPAFLLMVILSKKKKLEPGISVLIPLGLSVYLMIFNAFFQSPFAIDLLLLGMGFLFWFVNRKRNSGKAMMTG